MSHGLRPDWSGRLQKLQSSLGTRAIDALVVSTPINIRYLCGFTGTAGLLVLTADHVFLVVDGRYVFAVTEAQMRDGMAQVEIERVERRYDLTLSALAGRKGLSGVGFEAGHVTVATLGAWQRAAPTVEWRPTEQVVELERIVKDAGEVAIFRRAGQALAAVAGGLRQIVARDRSEREIAASIDTALLAAGFSQPAFPTIVASGPNSALPHARPTDRRLVAGDLVVLDFGGVLDGYCVDLTRMAAVGPVAPQAEALFSAVRAAHGAGLAAIRPGIAASAIDAAARSVLEARGLGEAFMHSTGHGLGLEVHEAPRIARPGPDAPEVIEAGMVFTIEPGAYVEHVGGVRLEDDVLATVGGYEVLTEAPRDLLVV